MPTKVIFPCETCQAEPDAVTQSTLEGQLRDHTFGEFRDARPGGWLIWTGGGGLGSKRYACPAHRDELIADVRRLHGAIRCGVAAQEPYAALWPDGVDGLEDLAAPGMRSGGSEPEPRTGIPALAFQSSFGAP